MSSVPLLVVVVAFLLVAFLWPIVRVWRADGVWPVVFAREAAPVQRLFGALTGMLLLAVLAAAVAGVALGPAKLGVVAAPAWVGAAGWLSLLGGFVVTAGAQRQMGSSFRVGIDDRPTALVTAGLFRWVRNPIFSGLLLFLAGFVALMPAWWSGALWLLTAAGLRWQIGLEERHLIALHGAGYLAYAARVGRLVPGLGRLSMTGRA